MLRHLFQRISPAGAGARLSILIFHRVLPVPDPVLPDLPDAIRFDRILRWMKSWFNVLPLDEAARSLVAGTLPDRPAVITFDDGYADNFTVALPALLKHQLSATFFIATGFLDGGRMWNDTIIEAIRRCPLPTIDLGSLGLGTYPVTTPSDRIAVIGALIGHGKYLPAAERAAFAEGISANAAPTFPSDLMMTSSQVQDLRRAGMQIGAHTVSHPMLTRLTLHDARDEIAASKAQLERMVGERVELFAYPNGKPGSDYTEAHVGLVRDLGFTAAVSTEWGTADRESDPLQLPRFTPWDRAGIQFGLRLAANMYRRRPQPV